MAPHWQSAAWRREIQLEKAKRRSSNISLPRGEWRARRRPPWKVFWRVLWTFIAVFLLGCWRLWLVEFPAAEHTALSRSESEPQQALEHRWTGSHDAVPATPEPVAVEKKQATKALVTENPDDGQTFLSGQPADGNQGAPASVADKARLLPDIIYIPIEDAVADVELEGWEDAWYSELEFNETRWTPLQEPKIDFVYLWVNGSQAGFAESKRDFEIASPLNDAAGVWIKHHSTNRYRDWDELRYSIRSLEKYTGAWKNTIQLLVNSIPDEEGVWHKQAPLWLNQKRQTQEHVKIVSQEELFDDDKRSCLPSFNSLAIENQIFNLNSTTDHIFALSDDMLLGKPHAAADFYSPLYGPTFGFKTNSYNTRRAPTAADASRFGEKPYLIYTSWLLNRRFGERKRKGQVHFGHSIARSVMKEAMASFPRPAAESACQRFRGEATWQIYSWYVAFHYTIERHRETLLWSYLMHRADADGDGMLDGAERDAIMRALAAGMRNQGAATGFRQRNFYHLPQHLEAAGLEPPRVNTDVQWTSLDGPVAIHDLDCTTFDADECLAPGFGTPDPADKTSWVRQPAFATATVFERVAHAQPECGDCLLKLLLHQQRSGLGPLLPDPGRQAAARAVVLKALKRYQYSVVDPDALFVMVTDAEQVEQTLIRRFRKPDKAVGQLCLNDDVASEEPEDIADMQRVMTRLYRMLLPDKSPYER